MAIGKLFPYLYPKKRPAGFGKNNAGSRRKQEVK